MTIDEFKKLTEWAKGQKICRFKFDNVEVDFSNLALIEDLNDVLTPNKIEQNQTKQTNNEGSNDLSEEDEELLYYSVR